MKIRTERRFGRHHYEAVLEDEFGFSVFGANAYGQTAAEARKALEDMIVRTMKHADANAYVFVEDTNGNVAVFHLRSIRGTWEYAIIRPGQNPGVTIFGSQTQTQEQAMRAMVNHAQQYGRILGFSPDYYKDLLAGEKTMAAI